MEKFEFHLRGLCFVQCLRPGVRYDPQMAPFAPQPDPQRRLQWLADTLLAALEKRDFSAIDESLAEVQRWEMDAFRGDPLLEEKADVLLAVAQDLRTYRWSCMHLRLLRHLSDRRRRTVQ